MARNRVIYQSQAVYAQQTDYTAAATTLGVKPNIRELDRVQSANYSFSIARTDVNQFGNLAAIDQIVTEAPTVSLDLSYYQANLQNEEFLGFNVLQSGNISGFTSCISKLIDNDNVASQKNYYILTSKEGSDVNMDTSGALNNTGNYAPNKGASIIGIGNAFINSYSSEASVGGVPTVSVSVEGQNMNVVNLPYTGAIVGTANATGYSGVGLRTNYGSSSAHEQQLVGISGVSPAVNPVDGSAYNVDICLPAGKSNPASTGAGPISTLRAGDLTLTLQTQSTAAYINADDASVADRVTAENEIALVGNSGNVMNSVEYFGPTIDNAKIQSYTLSTDFGRSALQQLGNRFASTRLIEFPLSVSLSVDAVVSDMTSGSLGELIDCEQKYDARITMNDPTCDDPQRAGNAGAPAVINYIVKGMKLDSISYNTDIGSNQTATLDFTAQVGSPEQKSHGLFMSGWHLQAD
tara:strand:- start:4057 stop:5451 length:1395 start_codon:yes stop_codon:yes gene_type:complete